MTKEAEFKSRFFAILKDLQDTGVKDAPTMWLLGSLASDLADNVGKPTWSGAKSSLDPRSYDALLRTFRDEGNSHHRDGRAAHAYAIQALTVSLIASTQRIDPHLAQGEALIDAVIDAAVTAYRKDRTTPPASA
jgi:hypothetical protein